MGVLQFDISREGLLEEALARLHGLGPSGPGVCLRELMVGMDPLLAPETAEQILREWGPFLWRRSGFAGVDTMLVVGVHTGTGSISFLDAGGRGGVRVQPYAGWIARWRNHSPAWTVRVMSCRLHGPRWQGRGGCPHAAQAIRLQEDFRQVWVA